MARLKEIPCATLKTSPVQLSTEQEEISLLPVLQTWPITKEVDYRHGWIIGLNVVEYSTTFIGQNVARLLVDLCTWILR